MQSSNRPTKLIAIFGAPRNFYDRKRYQWNKEESCDFHFPQSALIHFFKPPKAIFLASDKAREYEGHFREELKDFPVSIEFPEIKTPSEEGGIQSIIKAILDNVKEGEDIHLDITTGLRAITFLAFSVSTYLEHVRGARISRLTYVNSDEQGKKQGASPSPAQIMDLTEYLRIPQLLVAGEILEKYGDIEFVARAIESAYPNTLGLKEVEYAAEAQRRIQLLRIQELVLNGGQWNRIMTALRKAFKEQAGRQELLIPLRDSLEAILEDLRPGSDGDLSPRHIARLARFYFKSRQLVQTLLLMDEAIAFLCAEWILKKDYTPQSREKGGPTSQGYVEEALEKLKATPKGQPLADRIRDFNNKVGDNRNTVAHCELGRSVKNSDGISFERIKELLAEFERICEELHKM